MICYIVFSFCRFAISATRFLVVFHHLRICKICCSSTYNHDLHYFEKTFLHGQHVQNIHLKAWGIADLPLLRTLLTKVPRVKFLGSDGLFCFIRICKFGSFKNPFSTITSLPELCFRFRSFVLLVEMKKVTSMNYGSSTGSWKPWR